MFCWATVVYCPVVYWIWGGGWALSYRSGALDYAGGGPVEILSGMSAFVYSAFLGRRNETLMINYRPHNISTIFWEHHYYMLVGYFSMDFLVVILHLK